MSATRIHPHRFSACGHKGFGVECHRCAEAKRFEAIASGKIKPKADSFKGRDKEWFRQEAKRLLGAQSSKKIDNFFKKMNKEQESE